MQRVDPDALCSVVFTKVLWGRFLWFLYNPEAHPWVGSNMAIFDQLFGTAQVHCVLCNSGMSIRIGSRLPFRLPSPSFGHRYLPTRPLTPCQPQPFHHKHRIQPITTKASFVATTGGMPGTSQLATTASLVLGVALAATMLNSWRLSHKPILHGITSNFFEEVLARCPTAHSEYHVHPLLANRHVETILAAKLRRSPGVEYTRETLRMADGGTVTVDTEDSDQARALPVNAPVMLILPGLTGGSHDRYVQHMVVSARQAGFRAVVFNSRGTSDSPVTSPQFYSASFTGDLRLVVDMCGIILGMGCAHVCRKKQGGCGARSSQVPQQCADCHWILTGGQHSGPLSGGAGCKYTNSSSCITVQPIYVGMLLVWWLDCMRSMGVGDMCAKDDTILS